MSPVNVIPLPLTSILCGLGSNECTTETLTHFIPPSRRVAVAGLLIEAAKAGIKAAVRRTRRQRLRAAVDVVLDSVLPTVFFGPALGVWHGISRILPPLWPMRGSGAAGAASSLPLSPPAVAGNHDPLRPPQPDSTAAVSDPPINT